MNYGLQYQPRPQGPPREKLPTNSHAEGPGDEVDNLTT